MRHLCLAVLLLAAPASAAAPDFDKDVAPLIARRCLDCHSGADPKGGLDLSRKKNALATLSAGKPDDSALYQGLYRLEGRELIAAEWGITENGRRARYYKVTSRGRAHLKQETATWVRYTETVTGILTGAQDA